jgi:hypothetical protein
MEIWDHTTWLWGLSLIVLTMLLRGSVIWPSWL